MPLYRKQEAYCNLTLSAVMMNCEVEALVVR